MVTQSSDQANSFGIKVICVFQCLDVHGIRMICFCHHVEPAALTSCSPAPWKCQAPWTVPQRASVNLSKPAKISELHTHTQKSGPTHDERRKTFHEFLTCHQRMMHKGDRSWRCSVRSFLHSYGTRSVVSQTPYERSLKALQAWELQVLRMYFPLLGRPAAATTAAHQRRDSSNIHAVMSEDAIC